MKNICHVFGTQRNAVEAFNTFAERHPKTMIGCIKSNMEIILSNGETHYFLNELAYERWCLGKTYILGGATYHSGYRVADEF